jgi:REP element-mobilizing transposase RayT
MPPNLRQRKPNRQPGIDYTLPGFYFVTICTKEKEDILGKINGETMVLNNLGRIVRECWLALPDHYRCCRLHEFVIMPNHVHGIIEIVGGPNVG